MVGATTRSARAAMGIPRPDRIATVRDVAAAAGVSSSTAARALSGRGYVSHQTRIAVAEAVDRLGYVPNRIARGLRARATRAVGVLISDLRNPFYSDLASGVERGLRDRDYHMILADSDGSVVLERAALRMFQSFRVDGVILTPTPEAPNLVMDLARAGMPVVEVDRLSSSAISDGVVVENEAGAYQAVRHLLELGHTKIGILAGETDYTTGAGRLRGCRRAFKDFGIEMDESLIVHTSFHTEDAQTEATSLLREHRAMTAMFATNNVLAKGAVRAIWEAELRLARDVSLVAFDDADWMTFTNPAITTVAQPTLEMGREAAALMLDRLSGDLLGPPIVRTLPTRFVRRESTAPPRITELGSQR